MPPRDHATQEIAASCGYLFEVERILTLSTRNPENHTMSRRTATVEEEFDDDTDLPLPSRLPNTGTRGAILEEIGIEYDREVDEHNGDEDDDPDFMEFGNAQPSAAGSASRQEGSNSGARSTVTDIKPYKS